MDISPKINYTTEEIRQEIVSLYLLMVAAGEFEDISLNKFISMLVSLNEIAKPLPDEVSK